MVLVPLAFLLRFFSLNPTHLAIVLFGGVYLSLLNFGELVLNALLFWALPALALNHIALRWRLSFLGFTLAGAVTGLLGLLGVGLADYVGMTMGFGPKDLRTVADWQRFTAT